MAQNKAAQDLAALQQSMQLPTDREAQERAAEDAKRGASAGQIALSGDGEANFAAPEALATAVGASFILGPVGGILLGVAQGILGKRMRQNALDEFAEKNAIFDDVAGIVGDELTRMDAAALTEEDRDQVGGMQTQFDTVMKLVKSSSPELQQLGAAQFQDLQKQMNEYFVRQETQQLSAEAADAEARRLLDDTQYSRYNTLMASFRNESAEWETMNGDVNVAMQALQDGTPAQLSAAITKVAKALDPIGVVRPEDEKKWEALGSLKERLVSYTQQLIDGRGLTIEQRNDMQGLLDNIRDRGTEIQLAREARYLQEGIDLELPDKYLDNFVRVTDAPIVRSKTLEGEDRSTEIAKDAADAVTVPVTDAMEGVTGFAQKYLSDQAIGSLVDMVGDKAAAAWLNTFVPDSVTADRPKSRREREHN